LGRLLIVDMLGKIHSGRRGSLGSWSVDLFRIYVVPCFSSSFGTVMEFCALCDFSLSVGCSYILVGAI